VKWVPVTGRDVRLEALDFGGEGPGVLLLHGLAGTALEWEGTATWLMKMHRVVALNQRGHGQSERRPGDVTPAAFDTPWRPSRVSASRPRSSSANRLVA
jgi:pimeloyl-ACP methyl ester carboxylesterase